MVDRGDFTLWISEEEIEQWRHKNKEPKVGRENPERVAVPLEHIQALLPHLSEQWPVIAAAGHFYDVHNDYEGEMWLYDLPSHKTAKKIDGRAIPICHEARAVLEEHLSDGPGKLLFPDKRGNAYTTRRYWNDTDRPWWPTIIDKQRP